MTAVDHSPAALDSLFQALASDRRREILDLVADRSETGMPRDDLAAQLVVVMNAPSLGVIDDDDRRHTHIELVHRDLPALIDAGVLTTTDDDAVIKIDSVVDDLGIGEAIAESPSAELDGVFEALADSRRRTALSVLAGTSQPVSTRALAADVAMYELDVTEQSLSAEDVDRILTSLVHFHLPILNDAGLVAYDEITARVAYEGHPVIQTAWLDSTHGQSAAAAAIALANE